MFKFIFAAAALFPMAAFAEASLGFGNEGTELKKQMHVFIDKAQPGIRCMCSRFSVAIDDGVIIPGPTRSQAVMVLAKNSKGTLLVSETASLSGMFRHPGTPVVTNTQFVIMGMDGFADDTVIQVMSLKKKCMNPSESECMNLEVGHYGEFKASELKNLAPVDASELTK